MAREITPTDPDSEAAKGRVMLWLDPADLSWLANHCGCAADAPQEEQERCTRIRFRANAALHKAGYKPAAESSE